MARTKQTARKSTGGKEPRKQLKKSASSSTVDSTAQSKNDNNDDNEFDDEDDDDEEDDDDKDGNEDGDVDEALKADDTHLPPPSYSSTSSSSSSASSSLLSQEQQDELARMLTTVDAICTECAVLATDLGKKSSSKIVVELVRFLLLKALFRDVDASQLSPSSTVDAAWHALLLRPLLYISVCDRLLPADAVSPRVLDHNPAGKKCAQRPMRYRLTHARYLEVFRQAPPEAFWPVNEMSSSSSDSSSGASGSGKRPRHKG